ncbi:MAG: PLP-dependent aspartate aminotransferase family protein [Proteobacteria bacterium]|nr:PLP-dependent aspartate aminotransferase family protein [Pseudomonadota bacterium]
MAIEDHDYTRAVHAGMKIDESSGAVAPVIVTSTTFKQKAPGQHQGYDYSRADNPTREQLEVALGTLEHAAHGLAFASGLAAVHAVMGLLKSGDHVVAVDDVYGGTRRLFEKIWQPLGLHFHFLDLRDLHDFEHSLIEFQPKAVWLESPTNPTLRVIDLQGVARLTKKHNTLLVVDNTFATPMLQKPLRLGADIVLHSSTKYLSGHTDVVGGSVMTNDQGLYEKLKFIQFAAGAVPSPFDCYLLLRSLATLAIRMEKHCYNALAVAKYLESHPRVSSVLYPGLASHPQYQLAMTQMLGSSGMVSFYFDGTLEQLTTFFQSTHLFVLAESLGSTKSLMNHPAAMTHASVDSVVREKLGITDKLVRLSIGIEHPEDLKQDLNQAFEKACSGKNL